MLKSFRKTLILFSTKSSSDDHRVLFRMRNTGSYTSGTSSELKQSLSENYNLLHHLEATNRILLVVTIFWLILRHSESIKNGLHWIFVQLDRMCELVKYRCANQSARKIKDCDYQTPKYSKVSHIVRQPRIFSFVKYFHLIKITTNTWIDLTSLRCNPYQPKWSSRCFSNFIDSEEIYKHEVRL